MRKEINFVETIYGKTIVEVDEFDDVESIHNKVSEKVSNGEYLVTNVDLEIEN